MKRGRRGIFSRFYISESISDAFSVHHIADLGPNWIPGLNGRYEGRERIGSIVIGRGIFSASWPKRIGNCRSHGESVPFGKR